MVSGLLRRALERWMIGRAPSFRVRNYLYRWCLFPRNRWCNVYLHRFNASDDRVPHDHEYCNVSVILAGRYLEHWHDGTSTLRKPGSVVVRGPRVLHWLEVVDKPVWTLFFHGPRVRTWGFMDPRRGWIPHNQYLTERNR